MTTVDASNVLRAGQIREEGEEENGTIRYRVHTERMCVVIAFRSTTTVRVITAWRKNR